MNNILSDEEKLLQELVNYQSQHPSVNSDYAQPVPINEIQYTHYPEVRNYQGLSVGQVGYAPSNATIESTIAEAQQHKVYYAPVPDLEPQIDKPVDNPKIKLNPKYYAFDKDSSQIKTAIYKANPDQFVVPVRKYNYKDVSFLMKKGYSGRSSDYQNLQKVLQPSRAEYILKNRHDLTRYGAY